MFAHREIDGRPWFDYEAMAPSFATTPGRLRELETAIRRVYGPDEPLVELRIIRTLSAVGGGHVTVDEAVAEFNAEADADERPRRIA